MGKDRDNIGKEKRLPKFKKKKKEREEGRKIIS